MPRPSAARFTVAIVLGAVLAVAIGALALRYATTELPALVAARMQARAAAAAREIAAKVSRALQVQPQVTVSQQTIVEQQSSVLRLVTFEKSVTQRQKIDSTWLHSTKTLELEGDFVIEAGFDLAKPFVIDVDRAGSLLRITLPPAQILGVNLRGVRFLRDEDGFWNKLTAEDRESALRELRQRMELAARTSSLLRDARVAAENRLTRLLATDGRTVTFERETQDKTRIDPAPVSQ